VSYRQLSININRNHLQEMGELNMQTMTGNMKTTIVCDEENEHTFSITKKLDGAKGTPALLIGLYPTLGREDVFHTDSTMRGLMNHLEEMEINEIQVVNLFSERVKLGARLSAKGLEVDEENMSYLEGILKDADFQSSIILAWGSTMSSSKACNESKNQVLSMIKKYRPKDTIYQIGCSNLELEENMAPHVLYLGIRHSKKKWYLTPFPLQKYHALETERKKKTAEKTLDKAKKTAKSKEKEEEPKQQPKQEQ
jgi:hypothetical protein